MDPFARKMILGTVAFAVFMITLLAALSLFYFHTHPRCTEQVLSQKPSPDGRWMAAVLQRRCGEESPFFIHVNLRAAGSPLRLGFFSGRVEDGEVFTAEETSFEPQPEIKWNSAGELAIQCAVCSSVHSEQRWGPIALVHSSAAR